MAQSLLYHHMELRDLQMFMELELWKPKEVITDNPQIIR